MTTNRIEQNAEKVFALDLYRWRLNKTREEKHEEDVNRELLRRQHN